MDGHLHPTLNYTSALLALDKHAEVRMVSHATLAGIPAGVPIGIPDAPASLPGKDQLLTGGWTVCNQSTTDPQGQDKEDTVLLVGHLPDRSSALSGRSVVVAAGEREYLLYRGYRHELTRNVSVALNLGNITRIPVAGTWLDTIPSGEPIAQVPVTNAGKASTAVPGRQLVAGQMLEVDDGPGTGLDDDTTHQFYLVLSDQLMSISPLQAAVQRVLTPLADPAVKIGHRELAGATRDQPVQPPENAAPRSRPEFAPIDDPEAAVCALFQPGDTTPQILVSASLSAADRPSDATAPPPDGAMRVAVPAGKAALIETITNANEQPGQGTIALVNDQGRIHPLADPQHVQQVLGYDGVVPVRIFNTLASRVPHADALSPNAARTPATGS
jgi:type VII secretion protein EccB